MAKILAFAGSARKDSVNKKLVALAAERARAAGAEVTLVDLADYRMPLYDGDLEAESGIPEAAQKLKALMKEHDGLLIACPEYNSSITPLLKNTIDWCSRAEGDEKPLAAYTGKTAALLAASPGGLGGLRGLVHVRAILGNIGVTVVPSQLALSKAFSAFGEGKLTDERMDGMLTSVVEELVATTTKLSG